MSNTIYTSEKVMPYVYWGTHRITGHYYIGSSANRLQNQPSHIDLGTRYFTSSKRVKEEGFENFNWIIIAEFFDSETGGYDAYRFEQELIGQHFKDPLNLNGYHDSSGKWTTIGLNPYRNKTEEELQALTIRKSDAQLNRSEEEKKKTKIKTQNTIDNLSNEIRSVRAEIRSNRMKNFRENQSDEQNAERLRKWTESMNNRSDEEKAADTTKKRILTEDQISLIVELRTSGLSFGVIHERILSLGIKISYSPICVAYRNRIKKSI